MNFRLVAFILILLTSFCEAFSQNHGFPFGESRISELNLNRYELDSAAEAIVLKEFGEVYFDNGDGKMVIQNHQKIKILTEQGLDQANFSILLRKSEGRKEEIVSIEGMTHYLQNGGLKNSTLDKEAIFFQENPNYTLVKFTLPNATIGSIVEVKYSISSPFIFNLYPWEFQSSIPKLQSELWALIPGNYSYNASIKGFLKLSKNDSELVKDCFSYGSAKADCSLLKFGMINIPAFKEEEFMTAKSNFLSAINFELEQIRYFDGRVDKITKEWKDVAQELEAHEDFGIQIKKAKNLFDGQIPIEIKNIPDPLERVKKIYDWIKFQYTWNDYLGKYSDSGSKKSFEQKKGNVGDINLALLGALQSADLSASPVILSTRANGLPNSLYPVLSDFNYVVVQFNNGENSYLLDATDHYMPFGLLPEICLNGKGRLIAKKEAREVEIGVKGKQKSITTLNLKINEEGSLMGTLQINSFDYDALDKRKTILSYSTIPDYVKSMTGKWKAKEIKNYEATNLQDLEKSVVEKMEIFFETHDATNVQRIYFNPFLLGRWKINPFKSDERIYPVDFGVAQEETVLVTLDYPSNYRLDELPKNVALAMPNKGGRFLFNCNNLGNKLTLSYSLSLTRAVYTAEEYHSLKELFARIVQLKQTDLVFIKN